jgi:hypothetical protein
MMKITMCVLSLLCLQGVAMAQGGPSGPGGGLTPPSIPPFPGSFSAGPIVPGPNVSLSTPELCDRILALHMPGDVYMPSELDSKPIVIEQPVPMTLVPRTSFEVKWQMLDRNSPTLAPLTSAGTLAGVLAGTGATGSWNGYDPGATILYDGSIAGGYASPAVTIMLGISGQWASGNAPYKYLYNAQYSVGTYESPSGSPPVATLEPVPLVVRTYPYSGESPVFWRSIGGPYNN